MARRNSTEKSVTEVAGTACYKQNKKQVGVLALSNRVLQPVLMHSPDQQIPSEYPPCVLWEGLRGAGLLPS